MKNSGVSFAQFKKPENTHGGVFLCNIPSWYQIAQRISYCLILQFSTDFFTKNNDFYKIPVRWDWLYRFSETKNEILTITKLQVFILCLNHKSPPY